MKLRFFPKPAADEAAHRFLESLNIPASEWKDPRLDLAKTPARLARMFKNELLASYAPDALEKLDKSFTVFPAAGDESLVHEGPISFSSLCSHHTLVFSGEAYIAYLPNGTLAGASKPVRVVEHFARMFQIQERMGTQICEYLHRRLDAKVTIVYLEAIHSCMRCRGVKQPATRMVTCTVRPRFDEAPDLAALRGVVDEFYQQIALIKRSH